MAYIERGTPYDKLNLTPKQKVPDSIRIENETNERKDLMDWLIDMRMSIVLIVLMIGFVLIDYGKYKYNY